MNKVKKQGTDVQISLFDKEKVKVHCDMDCGSFALREGTAFDFIIERIDGNQESLIFKVCIVNDGCDMTAEFNDCFPVAIIPSQITLSTKDLLFLGVENVAREKSVFDCVQVSRHLT